MGRSWINLAALSRSRRRLLAGFCGLFLVTRRSHAQLPTEDQTRPDDRRAKFPDEAEDPRLPDGKSQKNAIAKEQHEQALKDADSLVSAAEDLRRDLRRSGTFVVSVESLKKTEEIERLAKRIRGRLKS